MARSIYREIPLSLYLGLVLDILQMTAGATSKKVGKGSIRMRFITDLAPEGLRKYLIS